ncbi:MAG: MobA/MobL family protein, partial [Selenomonadaceae bacterium]|nr:MobA/MobL family protein [Selenomonadaceae bacterium]
KKFFQAADRYEGCGNRRYMEIEFALPNELSTVDQYRQIIEAFIAKHLNDLYFAYAIHEKFGALSNGQRHPHVHIMFSERLIDDVEKIKERTPKNFFKYPARKKKDGRQPSFEEKFNRGAPKARKWAEKSFLPILRADKKRVINKAVITYFRISFPFSNGKVTTV